MAARSTTVYIAETDDRQQPVPAQTLARARDAAASLQTALGLPVDVRTLTDATQRDAFAAVSVRFLASPADGSQVGGFVSWVPGTAYVYYERSTFEVCGGLAQTVVRHELLHALGFSHTDAATDLMYPELRYCDLLPSPREQFHFQVAMQERRR